MRVRDVETKVFFAKYLGRLFVHNVLKDSQILLPKADYERRYGKFPRYFSGWWWLWLASANRRCWSARSSRRRARPRRDRASRS